jgi:hypothetical protein
MKRLALSMMVVLVVLPSCRKQAESSSNDTPTDTPAPANTPPPTSAPSAGTNDISPLLTAAKDGRLDDVKALLTKGTSVNTTGPGGEIALHWAASANYMATCRGSPWTNWATLGRGRAHTGRQLSRLASRQIS